MEDPKLITLLNGSESERNQAITYLFKNKDLKKMIFSNLLKMGVPEEKVIDIFPECIMAFYKAISENTFKGGSKISTYMVSIARNKGVDAIRKRRKNGLMQNFSPENFETLGLTDTDANTLEIDEEEEKMKQKLLWQKVESLGEKCLTALRMWSIGESMESIRQAFNYGAKTTAATAVDRCRKKLRESIKSDQRLRDFLKFGR